MSRLEKLNSFETHAWLKKVYKKLNPSTLAIAQTFIAMNDHLSKDDFEKAVNRMFLDKPKPKNYECILELLANCNV